VDTRLDKIDPIVLLES